MRKINNYTEFLNESVDDSEEYSNLRKILLNKIQNESIKEKIGITSDMLKILFSENVNSLLNEDLNDFISKNNLKTDILEYIKESIK